MYGTRMRKGGYLIIRAASGFGLRVAPSAPRSRKDSAHDLTRKDTINLETAFDISNQKSPLGRHDSEYPTQEFRFGRRRSPSSEHWPADCDRVRKEEDNGRDDRSIDRFGMRTRRNNLAAPIFATRRVRWDGITADRPFTIRTCPRPRVPWSTIPRPTSVPRRTCGVVTPGAAGTEEPTAL